MHYAMKTRAPSCWLVFALIACVTFDRSFVVQVAVAGDAATIPSRPGAFATPVSPGEVNWSDGFWADRYQMLVDRSLPAMWGLMRNGTYKPFLQHFLIAAGRIDGEHHGAAWNDGDFYKFLEAVTRVNAVTRDAQWKEILDHSIEAIAAAQRHDGYLHTPVLIALRNGRNDIVPFQDRNNFEMYNMGHLMTLAAVHFQVTGERSLLHVAIKAADFLHETFLDPTPALARNSVCPSHYIGILDLYGVTREKRYFDLGNRFVAMRDLVQGGDDNQDRIPFLQQREAVGHAVRANYLFAGIAELYLHSDRHELLERLELLWTNVVTKKMYITGGCGALYDGASPDGSPDQNHITRVHQSYGRNYQLPNITAHNETCATIGNVMWNWRMYLATGGSRYIDVLERALYNGVLAGVSLSGTDYFYVNPLRNVDPLPTDLRWSRTRVPFVTSYCCPPNLLRIIAESPSFAYARTSRGIDVNLYGSSQLETSFDGDRLKLTQTANYPWDGDILLTVDACPNSAFSIRLRIPSWTADWKVSRNGSNQQSRLDAQGYVELVGPWRAGDRITLQLAMDAERIEAHPLVEEARNQVAIQRGPIVYCLESADLPANQSISQVRLRDDASLRVRDKPTLLGGVTTIETTVEGGVEASWNGNEWQERLYRPARRRDRTSHDVELIPYYAWGNRGTTEMTVWLCRD